MSGRMKKIALAMCLALVPLLYILWIGLSIDGISRGWVYLSFSGAPITLNFWELSAGLVLVLLLGIASSSSFLSEKRLYLYLVIGAVCSAALFYLVDHIRGGWTSYPPIQLPAEQITAEDLLFHSRMFKTFLLAYCLILLTRWLSQIKVRSRGLAEEGSH
jgi:apolipoprotein N-acyltransferase